MVGIFLISKFVIYIGEKMKLFQNKLKAQFIVFASMIFLMLPLVFLYQNADNSLPINPKIADLMPNTVAAYNNLRNNPQDPTFKQNFANAFKAEAGNIGVTVTGQIGDFIYLKGSPNVDGSFKNSFSAVIFKSGVSNVNVALDLSKVGTAGFGYSGYLKGTVPLHNVQYSNPFFDPTLPISGSTDPSVSPLKPSIINGFNPDIFFNEIARNSSFGLENPEIHEVVYHETAHNDAKVDRLAGVFNIGNIRINKAGGLSTEAGPYANSFSLDEIPRFMDSLKAYHDSLLQVGSNLPAQSKQKILERVYALSNLTSTAYEALFGVGDNMPSDEISDSRVLDVSGMDKNKSSIAIFNSEGTTNKSNLGKNKTTIEFPTAHVDGDFDTAIRDKNIQESFSKARKDFVTWTYSSDFYANVLLKQLYDNGLMSKDEYTTHWNNLYGTNTLSTPNGVNPDGTPASNRQNMIANEIKNGNSALADSKSHFLLQTSDKEFEGKVNSHIREWYGLSGSSYLASRLNKNDADKVLEIEKKAAQFFSPTGSSSGPVSSMVSDKTISDGLHSSESIDIRKPSASTQVQNASSEVHNRTNASVSGHELDGNIQYSNSDKVPIAAVSSGKPNSIVESFHPSGTLNKGLAGSAVAVSIPLALGAIAKGGDILAQRMSQATTDDERTAILNDELNKGIDTAANGLKGAVVFTAGSTAFIMVSGATGAGVGALVGGSAGVVVGGTVGTGLASAGVAVAVICLSIDALTDKKFYGSIMDYFKNFTASNKAIGMAANIYFNASANMYDAVTNTQWWLMTSSEFMRRAKDAFNNKHATNWVDWSKADGKAIADLVNQALEMQAWANNFNTKGKRNWSDILNQRVQDFANNPKNPTGNSAANNSNSGTNSSSGSGSSGTNNPPALPKGPVSISVPPQSGKNVAFVSVPVPAGKTSADVSKAIQEAMKNGTVNVYNVNIPAGIDTGKTEVVFVPSINASSSYVESVPEYPFVCYSGLGGCNVFRPDRTVITDANGKPMLIPLDKEAMSKGLEFPQGMTKTTSSNGTLSIILNDGTIEPLTEFPGGTLNQMSKAAGGEEIAPQNCYIGDDGSYHKITVVPLDQTVPNSNSISDNTINQANNSCKATTGAVPKSLPPIVYGELVK